MTIVNLYIIENVLFDWTPGMAVIAAPSLERCREIFTSRFQNSNDAEEFDTAVEHEEYKVVESVNQAEGVVSYVYGGG